MRGSDANWPADDVVPDTTTDRAEGSRMLLDDLMAERERGQTPQAPEPVLTVDPIAVPPAGEIGRRAARERLAELENAARRNLRSAEEARAVLRDEHQRLHEEVSARTKAQQEASALRRELDRLRDTESRRAAKDKTRAERAARKEIADELKQFHAEHQRVTNELEQSRATVSDRDVLLDEYQSRLREEQQARAGVRAELERTDSARRLAERALEAATDGARRRAEDEMIRLATAEQELVDARSDRDRLSAQLADLTAGDGALGRMAAQADEKDSEIARLHVQIADLTARLDATEDAAERAISERDAAFAAHADSEQRRTDAERARLDGDMAVDVASARITELEASMTFRLEEAEARAHDAERIQGQLRREASDAVNRCRSAEAAEVEAASERDTLRARVDDFDNEIVRARAESDRLRAHAAALGEELAAVRATVAELQAAAPAPSSEIDEVHPPLPSRVAGRQAPPAAPEPVARPPLERRHRKPAPNAVAGAFAALSDWAPSEMTRVEEPSPVGETEPGSATPWPPGSVGSSPEPPELPEPVSTYRRTAMAELSSIAARGDDFVPRKR